MLIPGWSSVPVVQGLEDLGEEAAVDSGSEGETLDLDVLLLLPLPAVAAVDVVVVVGVRRGQSLTVHPHLIH